MLIAVATFIRKWLLYAIVRAAALYTGESVVTVLGSSYAVAGNMVKKLGSCRKNR